MKTVIKAESITKRYNRTEQILKGITLEIEEGTFTVLLGQSGSGKTTLLNVLSGLLKPTAGSVWYREKEINKLSESELALWKRTATGNVFQNYLLLNNLTARENIEIGKSTKSISLDLDELVKLLQLEEVIDKFPGQLSGGQQQRVAIARAVIKRPDILFCDEATGALDEENSKKVVELLHHLKEKYHITILFVTHNLQIAETADRVITIKDGRVARDQMNSNPIAASEMVWG